MNFKSKVLCSALTASLLTLACGEAVAQDNENVNGEEARVLDPVTVNARKRAESLQDAPLVVNTVSAEVLNAFNVDSVDNLSALVPGLTATADSGTGATPQINIRGVQAGAINLANDQPVSINIDGIQFSNSAILRVGTFDLEGVEVLKGPQALFFGKNSPAGIVALRTANPTDEFYTEVSAGYEFEAEAQNFTAIVSGPISTNLKGRLAGQFISTDGHYTNARPDSDANPSVTRYDEFNIRGTLQADFDATTVTAKLTYSDRDGGPNAGEQPYLCADAAAILAATGDDCTLNGTISFQDPEDAVGPFGALYADNIDRWTQADPFGESQVVLASLEVESDLNEDWTFNSLTGLNSIDTHDFTTLLPAGSGVFILERDARLEGFSQEVRFLGDFDKKRLMFGAFYDDRTVELRQVNNIIGVQYPTTKQTVESQSFSVFGQVEYDFTEQLSLSVGGRYINEDRTLFGQSLTSGGVLGAAAFIDLTNFDRFNIPAGALNYAETEVSSEDFSPEVTLSYKPNDDTLLYASYKQGFKSGGFDFGTTTNPAFSLPLEAFLPERDGIRDRSFQDESVDGFEVGLKTELLENTLRLNAAAFMYDYDDLQFAVFDPETIAQRTLNAATASVDGFELDLTYLTPVEGLTLTGNLNYVDATFDEFFRPCNSTQDATSGCNVDLTDDGVVNPNAQDGSGQPLIRAPEWIYGFGLNYEADVSSNLLFRANLGATWTDEYQTETNNDPRAIQDSHWLVNAAVGIGANDDSWALDLVSTNLTDEAVLLGTAAGNGPFADLRGSRNTPLEVMLRLTVRPSQLFGSN